MAQGNPIRQAIVVIIERDDGKLLTIERAAHGSYPGYWNPVTGALEAEDSKSLAEAARREALEEVGLEVDVIGKLWESTTAGSHYVLHWFLAKPSGSLELTLQLDEVSDARWLSIAEFLKMEPSFADTRRFFREVYPEVRESLRQRSQ